MVDPETLVNWLTALGPWAVAGLLAYWLKLERAERIAAQTEATALRDQIADERQETAKALAEFGEAMRNKIRDFTEQLASHSRLVAGFVKSGKPEVGDTHETRGS